MIQARSAVIRSGICFRILKVSFKETNLSADTNYTDVINPESMAIFNPEKMGKSTIFQSEHVLVGLNAFEPGQAHQLHTHEGMDKVYHVLKGKGLFILEDREVEMEAGLMLVAPDGVPHGIRNHSNDQLIVLAILAPGP
jgi:quercetin dioxygenase-like cupin family protein